jgi:GNAT superfamily N-acetyltransferase
MTLKFSIADWTDKSDGETVVSLLQAYALHPMGGAEPLSDYASANLPAAMAQTPGAFSVIGWQVDNDRQRTAVALANCFSTLSTFACKPLVNIHDLYVADVARGQGAGQAMLDYVADVARSRGCCKVTLEVLTGNTRAVKAYKRSGFVPYTLDDTSGHAVFMQRKIE